MGDSLSDVLASLEGHEFSHAGQTYSVVTVTANRQELDETKGAEAPVVFHATVTSPSRQQPIGLQLRMSAERATDLAYVRETLEDRVAKIVEGKVLAR
jgi:hypothetical protein